MSTTAMQIRCVHCGLEQYAPAVSKVSRGLHPCVWCGEYSVEMSEKEYRMRIDILQGRDSNMGSYEISNMGIDNSSNNAGDAT